MLPSSSLAHPISWPRGTSHRALDALGTRVREARREANRLWSVPLSQEWGTGAQEWPEGWGGANAGFWGVGSLASVV